MEFTKATWFTKLRGHVTVVSGWFEVVGLVAIVAMVLATLIDVVGSKFKWPLPGSTEMISLLQVVAVAAGLAFSKIDGKQIRVELLLSFLSERGKAFLEFFISILGLGLFVAAVWMLFEQGLNFRDSGSVTFALHIAFYPFSLWISLCCIPMCCVIIMELLSSFDKLLK